MAIQFKVLAKGRGYEVRKYPPQKRCITYHSSNIYFLPFPYLVFGHRRYQKHSYLFLAFAKEDDEHVYWPSVPNVLGRYAAVCLGSTMEVRIGGHYKQPATDMDSLIARFWQTQFTYSGWMECSRSLKTNYGSYRNWKALNVQQAIDALEYDQQKLESFIEKVKAKPSSLIQR